MLRKTTMLGWGGAIVLAAALAAPLNAGVREGVDLWSRGDYAAAVAQWQGPAAAGDADAMFNLAQAYRLGRGVPMDEARAESLYFDASRRGHVQAADIYGLMLFEDGRRETALPYVQAAAVRGDPRAMYLLGIAHFNGDVVERDWTRAYALLTLANGAGLPQAAGAIAEMDRHIPMEQRQDAAALARRLETEAVDARSVQLAAADLASGGGTIATAPMPGQPAAAETTPRRPSRVSVSPSVAAARDAVEQARQATGTSSPAEAGASYASSTPRAAPTQAATPAPRPTQVARAPEPVRTAATSAPEPAAAPARAASSNGPWRVQLGAFGVAGNAERLWARLSARSEIAGRQRLLIPAGRVTRLQAGGYASQSEAQTACNSLRRAGHDCLVTRN